MQNEWSVGQRMGTIIITCRRIKSILNYNTFTSKLKPLESIEMACLDSSLGSDLSAQMYCSAEHARTDALIGLAKEPYHRYAGQQSAQWHTCMSEQHLQRPFDQYRLATSYSIGYWVWGLWNLKRKRSCLS